jgi:SCY1-like protein 1
MGNSASALPYAIGAPYAPKTGVKSSAAADPVQEGWTLHVGTTKSSGAPVSVFVAKKPSLHKTPVHKFQPNWTQYAPAQHHFSFAKKLRHPHIVQVLATLDTDHPNDATTGSNDPKAAASAPSGASSSSSKAETGDLIIVTEPVVPFVVWFEELLDSNVEVQSQLAWGMECVLRALVFLHVDAKLSHGNLNPTSLFVTPAGDVKLFNFSLVLPMDTTNTTNGLVVSQHFRDYESVLTPDLYRSPERQQHLWNEIVTGSAANGPQILDSFSLGSLLQHCFSQGNLSVPAPLVKAIQRLQTSNIRMRPKLTPLLKCPVFADNVYAKIQNETATVPIMLQETKIVYYQNLLSTLQAQINAGGAGVLPKSMVLHKLMPLMKSGIETIATNEGMKAQAIYRRECKSAGLLISRFLFTSQNVVCSQYWQLFSRFF